MFKYQKCRISFCGGCKKRDKMLNNKKISNSSFNVKWNISLEPRFSTSRYIPPGVQELKWQEFAWEQFIEHLIACIREEIVNAAMSILNTRQFERKAFEFASVSLRLIWLRLFDWAYLKLEQPYSSYNISEKPVYSITDIEPQPLLPDSWTLRKIPRVFAQELLLSPKNPMSSSTSTKKKSMFKKHTKINGQNINVSKLTQNIASSELRKPLEHIEHGKQSSINKNNRSIKKKNLKILHHSSYS